MNDNTEFTNVERLKIMEEKCGVILSGVYAQYDEDSGEISAQGEIQPTKGTSIPQDISLFLLAYNSKGQVIAKHTDYFFKDDFFCTSPFSLSTEIFEKPAKIKIYPILD